MGELIIHPRMLRRRSQLREENVRTAWENAYYEALHPDSPDFPEYLRIGTDSNGREIEMVGVSIDTGWPVYHANPPLSKRTRIEIESARRR